VSLRLVEQHDEPTYAVHRNQFHSRQSGLNIGYWREPWYTKRIWKWTGIALIAVLALIALWWIGDGGNASY